MKKKQKSISGIIIMALLVLALLPIGVMLASSFMTTTNLLRERNLDSQISGTETVYFARDSYIELQKKNTQHCTLKSFFDYLVLDRAFFNRKLSPVKLKMCA